MKLYDQHLHSRHSVDSNADPVANCEQAVAAGLAGLTFTEHYDMHPRDWDRCRWDYDAIAATIDALRKRFSPPLGVGFGIEVDYQPEMIEETLDYLDRHPFDLVLLSVHWISGRTPREWREVGAEAMRRAYLTTLRGAADLCRELAAGGSRPFDVLSHFDYVKRYLRRDWGVPMGPVDPAVLDPILQALIDADVVPEINTSGMRRPEAEAYPSWSVLHRYRELGGRAVSIGSDAHHSRDIGAGFGEVAERLQAIGFEGEAVFRERVCSIVPW